jgi:hypothetical protein
VFTPERARRLKDRALGLFEPSKCERRRRRRRLFLAADIDGRREPTNERDETHFWEGVSSALGLLVNQVWSFGGDLRLNDYAELPFHELASAKVRRGRVRRALRAFNEVSKITSAKLEEGQPGGLSRDGLDRYAHVTE